MKFKIKSFYKKCLALLLLQILLTETFLPTIAFALTSGPTAPEATSFEPIDTTDMVNPLTGDFTYNLPLLEVPGPEGGYPLSLSYHAGIQPNEEASWVGLGWTLNPGAITRNVNGFADDFNDVSQVARDYWAGGSRSTFGISVGLPVGVSFGLSFSQDTYQGFGLGTSIGYGFNFVGKGGKESPFGIGFNLGTDGYGNSYASVGLFATTNKSGETALGLTGSIGLSTNFNSVGSYAGAAVTYSNSDAKMGTSLIGASIGSGSSKVGLSIGGGTSSVHNTNSNKIQTSSSGFGFTIPLPGGFSVGISHNYTRYWADNSSSVLTQGSLYMPKYQFFPSHFNNRTTDIYRLTDHKNYSIATHPDPEQLQGGTFPAFDNYSVNAQGLSGSMRPYIYQSNLYSQNIRDKSPQIIQNTGNSDGTVQSFYGEGVKFRFMNDFSNSYRQSPINPNTTSTKFAQPVYGNNDGNYGYSINGYLAGSKHIRYFTNDEINYNDAKIEGFINTQSAGFSRMGSGGANTLASTKGQNQIGGFMITNASGVTYHYALPAYSYNEFSKTQTVAGAAGGYRFTSQTKSEPYAYTWYLTAITGPDFVDRDDNGLVNEGDWGYWVSFEYGKWTDGYNWRNPSEGMHKDLENGYESYSNGQKELYYLDAVKTRTHTALFVKEIRADAKGTTEYGSTNFRPSTYSTCGTGVYDEFGGEYTESFGFQYPKASLALKKVLLFKNDQVNINLNTIRQASNDYNHEFNFNSTNCGSVSIKVHNGLNVIDKYDIDNSLEQSCLRAIDFNYDYSLSKGLPNSYDIDGTETYNNSPNTYPSNLGKLTLKSVNFLGKSRIAYSSPILFEYDLDETDPVNQAEITIGGNLFFSKKSFTSNSPNLKEGDIIKFNVNGTLYYGVITDKTGNNYKIIYFTNRPPTSANGTVVTAYKTKNPPYNKDAYDQWGLYKSDYRPSSTQNENIDRFTSEVSNKATDVWSLRRIKTQLGADINIDYEGDTYRNSILTKNRSLIISDLVNTSQNTWTLTFANQGLDLTENLKIGDNLDFICLQTFYYITESGYGYNDYRVISTDINKKATILNISGNQIQIEASDALNNQMKGFDISSEIGASSINCVKGNATILGINNNFGGGIRTKAIIIKALTGDKKSTNYTYTSNNFSSGITSYEPVGLPLDDVGEYNNEVKKTYRKELYKDINYLLTVSSEVPAPGVMYEYVTIEDEIIKPDGNSYRNGGKISYQYRVFNTGMLGIKEYYNNGTNLKNLSIKDYTSQIGNLVRAITYDDKGNKLTETINHFLNDDMVDKSFDYYSRFYEDRLFNYNYQGLIQERYADDRSFVTSGQPTVYKITTSGKDSYPIIQTGTTQIDYKNEIKIEQKNLTYDFYSGNVTKTLTTDVYGNRFINEVIPAYRRYSFMGLKTEDLYQNTHKNMLVQEAANYTYKVNSQNVPTGLLSASVQTWANNIPTLDENGDITTIGQSNIWRKKASFIWMQNGVQTGNLIPYSSFIPFDFSATVNNAAWKKMNEINKVNIYSSSLEASDINSNYAMTRMGYGNSKVIVSGSPAKYEEMTYAGVEDALLSNGKLSGNISLGNGVVSNVNAHTGAKSALIQGEGNTLTYQIATDKLDPTRDYIISAWVKAASGAVTDARLFYEVNGMVLNNPTFSKVAAGWYLLDFKIPASVISSGATLTIGCRNISSNTQLYFDDLRFQPQNATSSAYVYDQKTGELTYILDNNNLFVKFEYDMAGRLIKTYKEVLGKSNTPLISQNNYNYGNF